MPDFMTGSVTSEMPLLGSLLLCTICSLLFGFAVAALYMFRRKYSNSLAMTLVLIPAIVQAIIMLVNGNIGTGIAIAGAFSLVRFRSIPGNARDIGTLFFAMALGFVIGMGYLFYALSLLLLVGGVYLILVCIRFGENRTELRVLRITIPENLDYEGLFDEILQKYANSYRLDRVRTTNMGSLYELSYQIQLKTASVPKAFLDELRCRNGNLNIVVGREQNDREEL